MSKRCAREANLLADGKADDNLVDRDHLRDIKRTLGGACFSVGGICACRACDKHENNGGEYGGDFHGQFTSNGDRPKVVLLTL